MKFIVDYTDYNEPKKIIYNQTEYSLDTIPCCHEIDFEIAVKSITLTVVDSIVVQLWGMCGLSDAQQMIDCPPVSRKGLLKVADVESYIGKSGSFLIHDTDLPIFINSLTGWLCIGDSKAVGVSVEFLDNCIFLIDEKQEFIALWIHPSFV